MANPGKLIQNFFHPKFQFSGVWYRRISGILIQYFFKISISEAWAGPISGKPVHIWISFPDIGLCHAPEFIKSYFSTIWLLDEFSRDRSSSYPGNLPNKYIFIWFKKLVSPRWRYSLGKWRYSSFLIGYFNTKLIISAVNQHRSILVKKFVLSRNLKS